MIRLLDYIFITRPILFFPGWATLLLGKWLAVYRINGHGYQLLENILPDFSDLLLLSGFALLMGGSFILNQIRDAESDRINKKLFFIHKDIITLRSAWIEAVFLLIAGTLIYVYTGNTYIIYCGSLFILVTGYLYNFRPFELKNLVFGGLIANMLMGECAFAIGYFSEGLNDFGFMLSDSIGILLLNTGLYIFTTLPDIEGDQASNKNTIGAWLGSEMGTRVGVFVIIIGLFLLPLDVIWVWIFIISVFPFLLRAIFKPEIKNAVIALKLSIFMLSFLVTLYWPWFLLVGIVAFWGTKIYFKKRFSYDYPNFSGS